MGAPDVSIYDQRVRLVADTITKNSGLDAAAATKPAITVLRALDRHPETVREPSTITSADPPHQSPGAPA